MTLRAWPTARPEPATTCWNGNAIVVARRGEPIDRLCSGEIERVTLIHAGAGESPGDVRAALFELAGRTVLLGAETGITGRVLFERQTYWSQRNCIYWVDQRRVAWPAVLGEPRWPWLRPRVPQYRSLAPAAAAALFEHAQSTGPHTWDERKRHRIERRRPFRGHAIAATAERTPAMAV